PTTELSGFANFLAGGFGGMCLVIVGHPLDLLKVKLQTGGQYKGVADAAAKTLQAEGPRGFYRGVSAPLVGVTPIFATCFWGYDMGLKLCSRAAKGKDADAKMSLGEKMLAGAFSALPATALTAPVERIKCLLQIQGEEVARGAKPKYLGMVDCARKLHATGGFGSVFKGWEVTLMRDVPGSVAYFGVYEFLKEVFAAEDGTVSSAGILSAGGFAGMATWAVAIPPDVIKSRWQTAAEGTYSNLGDVLRTLLREEGAAALYRGVAPAMLRAFPANAACFFGVDLAKSILGSAGL
ncbi:unnamed protein product, partial [Ectocarpus sp. 6 AP-2014]